MCACAQLCTRLLIVIECDVYAYGWILSGVLLSGILSQRAATVQLYVKLVVIPPGAVYVHAIRIVRVSGRVQQTAERPVESYAYFHVIVLALGFDV